MLIALVVLDRAGMLGHRGGDWARFDQQNLYVTEVIDGDTVRIASSLGSDDDTLVRLIGIDAPEQGRHFADRSTAYLAARARGRTVTIRLEPTQTRDRYRRLLAYLYLNDSECLNLSIVRDGQAFADRRFRHTLRPQFEAAENEARKRARGLWENLTEEQMPEWRRDWLRERRW